MKDLSDFDRDFLRGDVSLKGTKFDPNYLYFVFLFLI